MSDVTAAWVRNPGDEKAVASGCRFDAGRGAYAVWWVERYCQLYEGEQAGEPLTLRGCHECEGYGLPRSDSFRTWEEAGPAALERAGRYAECVAAGHSLDWQYECVIRLFGWVKHSRRWNREVRRFRQASIWVPKKNKKSPTLAALGLYLLCGDGEPGQKVFFAAKDGTQARDIAGKHAMEMMEASADLSSVCTPNKNLMQVTHEPSRSILRPLSSSNSRTQMSKEGLNGSVLIDETHVVDREFVGRISRAGISRSEPLHVEVSTAGSDPEGYGKERFDHAVRVLEGEVEDEQLFAAVYAAPQTLTDLELDEDPLKYGRLANPAMGHTVDPEEYLADYALSRRKSLGEFALFKMYRLNLWQASETPWLDMGAWARCRRRFTEADLYGRPCAAGLDLAKTRDTCSLVLSFPDDEGEYKFLPYYWLPKERAELLRDKVNYLGWGAAGHVFLTEGSFVDYALIRTFLIAVREKFELKKLAYDDRYAEEMVQRLIEEDQAFTHEEIEPFGQTVNNFAGPTDEFESLVRSGKLCHDGNPLFTWQAGNARVKVDANHNKRPVKQRFGDHRTIDGVVAAIMALALAQKIDRAGSVYETRGIDVLSGPAPRRRPWEEDEDD